jgi:hypothetical protein
MAMNSTRLERLVIFAADKEGRIPVPKGNKSGLQTIRKALALLKKRGLVRKEESPHADGSPYVLTDLGKHCREYMTSGAIQSEVSSMNWSAAEPLPPSSGLV